MGFKISDLRTDPDKEKGTWVDFGGGLRVKVAKVDNLSYLAYLRKITKPYIAQIRGPDGAKALSLTEDLNMQAVAKHILLGWENMDDDDGKPILYSEKVAYDLFKSTPEFYRMVIEIASDLTNFRTIEKAESLGNSLPT